MRGAEDPPTPLDNVLHDGRGFKQVVACVIETRVDAAAISTRIVAGVLGVARENLC